jgi:DHA1 family bicyclomycin/chloramphenicol resistance-like MFS transporter
MQMFLSSVSAGLVAPLVWGTPLGLAIGMACYCLIGWAVIRNSHLWRSA